MGLLSEAGSLQAVLYVYLAVAFTLMLTVFHHKCFLRKFDDFCAFLLYFACFFLTLMFIPCLMIFLLSGEPISFLAGIGFTFGSGRKGLLFMAAAIPFSLLSAYIGSRDPAMKRQYPFSKSACSSLRKFLFFETAYLFLYYSSWEFVFRGLLFFPLVSSLGLLSALAIQTLLSTLYHIGHPETEIFGSLAGGFIFGFIAYSTGSFFTTVFIHALIGISTDSFLYSRHHRRPG